ncbi:MAG: hypothetical protein AB7Q17_05445 [Phycisphaerae bacterium]
MTRVAQRFTAKGAPLLALVIASTSIANADQWWAVTAIDLLPGGTAASATDINDRGIVVGGSPVQIDGDWTVGVIWSHGRLRAVPEPAGVRYFQARAISSSGTIAGDASVSIGDNPAYVLLDSGSRRIGTLGGGEANSWAINSHNVVVGSSEIDSTMSAPVHAFVWDDQLRDLGTLGGHYSDAHGVNDPGDVVGSSLVRLPFVDWVVRAVLWSDGVAYELGCLPGDLSSSARAINNNGDIVGVSAIGWLPADGSLAILWRGGEIIRIGPLVPDAPTGYRFESFCTDINDHGEVIGSGEISFYSGVGFLWRDGVLVHLPALVAPDNPWKPSPVAINNAGQIACTLFHSTIPNTQRAGVLTPPECRGFPRGDANCDGVINNFDVDAFVMALADVDAYAANLAACNWLCNLDINRDGYVNNFDIDPFVELLVSQP